MTFSEKVAQEGCKYGTVPQVLDCVINKPLYWEGQGIASLCRSTTPWHIAFVSVTCRHRLPRLPACLRNGVALSATSGALWYAWPVRVFSFHRSRHSYISAETRQGDHRRFANSTEFTIPRTFGSAHGHSSLSYAGTIRSCISGNSNMHGRGVPRARLQSMGQSENSYTT